LDIFFVSKAVENAVFGEPFLINPVMSWNGGITCHLSSTMLILEELDFFGSWESQFQQPTHFPQHKTKIFEGSGGSSPTY
jgi:hypothetical protein